MLHVHSQTFPIICRQPKALSPSGRAPTSTQPIARQSMLVRAGVGGSSPHGKHRFCCRALCRPGLSAAPAVEALQTDKSVALTGVPATAVAGDVVAGLVLGLSIARPGAEADAGKIAKTLTELDEEIAGLAVKLRNPSFLEKAPASVVEKTRRRLVELEERRAALSTGSR